MQLYKIMGFYPRNLAPYNEALKHKSYARIESDKTRFRNNERLEYLGDAVLGAVVSDILYGLYSEKQEGFLTMENIQPPKIFFFQRGFQLLQTIVLRLLFCHGIHLLNVNVPWMSVRYTAQPYFAARSSISFAGWP